MIKASILVLLTLCLTACADLHAPHHSTATVGHVVICWLKEPGNQAQRQEIIDRSNGLRQIPGIVSLRVGRPLPSTRPVVDSSYDVALVVMFKDEASLHAYETNPLHLKALHEVIVPLTAKRLIYDINLAPCK